MDTPTAIQVIIFVVQLALLVASTLFVLYWLTSNLSDHYDVPFVTTQKRYLSRISEALDIRPGDTVYDLGCGDGRVLIYCARKFPQARFIGIESNPVLVWYCRAHQRLRGIQNVSFVCGNIFETDLRDATRIYTYLRTAVMKKLFTNHPTIQPKTRLVSRAFMIEGKAEAYQIVLTTKPGQWDQHLLHVYEF